MGIEALKNRLKDLAKMEDVKQVVKVNGAELNENMINNAEFRGHFEGKKWVEPTRTTKKSIVLLLKDDGLTAEVGPHTEYAPYLEWGTRFMPAQMFAYPAFVAQKQQFIKDLQRLVK